MNKLISKFAIAACVAIANFSANAETVLLSQDFNGDYTKDFPHFLDHDGLDVNSAIASLFYSSTYQAYMPWWVAKDTRESTDSYMISHSYYTSPGQSSDWFVSRAIEVPTTGFVLSFDAKSYPIRNLANLSDLSLYVTETLIDPASLPTTPTKVWTAVPYGENPEVVEGDMVHYTLPLDDFAGKTIYLNFVNENYDKDILCLDNVKVARADVVNITLSEVDPYTADDTYEVTATIDVVGAEGAKNATLLFDVNGEIVDFWEIGNLSSGQTTSLTGVANIVKGEKNVITFRFKADNQEWTQTAEASITGLAFIPTHRLFVEETTSLHCGNCPIGMYTFEKMLEDPQFKDCFFPSSVHIAAMGYDPMATDLYYSKLPDSSVAPLVYPERETVYDGFKAVDMIYDPTNEETFAYRMARRIATPTYLDVDVAGKWLIYDEDDTTSVQCTATVRPAMTLHGANLRVAFILTENNVGLDGNIYWMQSNYLSGKQVEGNLGGWTQLSDPTMNLRFHDVARAISNYDGHPSSLPADMEVGQDYTYEFTLKVPNTYSYDATYGLRSDVIHTHYCELTAIVIDGNTGLVVNAARVPLGEDADNRMALKDMPAGIDDISVDAAADAPARYYDLMGRPVSADHRGFVIVRRGTTATKELRQ